MPSTPPLSRKQLVQQLDDVMFRLVWQYRHETEQLFRPLGLNALRAFILGLVSRETVHPGDLAQALDFSPSAVSHLLKELEDQELLRRVLDSSDRRKVRLELTDKGADLLERIRLSRLEMGVEKLAVLSDEEALTLLRLIEKLMEGA